MALKIRLRQQGRKNRQTFRLVVTDVRNPRDGKYLEALGSYDPHRAQNNLQLNVDHLNYWLGQGAELSDSLINLVKNVAPTVIQTMKDKKNAAIVKQAAQRRRLNKKDTKKAAPVKAAKKEAAATTEEAAPKKRRTTTKTKKKDES